MNSDGMNEAADIHDLMRDARRATDFLKSLSNPHRLVVLCLLCEGERNVGEMEMALGIRQPALSQQLARLRHDGLVAARRDGKSVYYHLASEEARAVIGVLYEQFCKGDD